MSRRVVLWNHSDEAGDLAELISSPDPDHVAALTATNLEEGVYVYLTEAAARGLRDALNRLFADDDAPTETSRPQPATDAAVALHAAQHLQLQAAARRIADAVGEQVHAVAQLIDQAEAADDWVQADAVPILAALLSKLAVQHQRTAASLGDLLSTIAGES